MADARERVLAAVDALSEEVVDFTSELVRLPTVNPPGEGYEECARGIGDRLQRGRIARGRTDYVIIPEPLGVERICIGHRGVWWFEVELWGRIAHGSMPFLGVSAIDHMAALLEAVRVELQPALATRRTAMPVVPEGAGRATLNVNAIAGGQEADGIQTPCVADRCRAIFDRRFLIEEGLEAARAELFGLLEKMAVRIPAFRSEGRDLMMVHPVRTP